MLIGLVEGMANIDIAFTRLKVKVTMFTFVKNNVNMVSAYYLENSLSQRFHISHADWS